MNQFFYLCLVALSLLLTDAAAQKRFQISGTATQPRICIERINAHTGRVNDQEKPCLYLLTGDIKSELCVAGQYTTDNSNCCFEPLYPLANGQRFLIHATGYQDTIIAIKQELHSTKEPPKVLSFYPLTDSIPKNILFFHIRFTQPMKEINDAWKKVSLRNEQGVLIEDVWRQKSFWLDSGRLLVLMIHPGRVKSGIHYHMGSAFKVGEKYVLSVDSSMTDIYEHYLENITSRQFYVLPELHIKLKASLVKHKIEAYSVEPIRIHFPYGIDHAAACTGIFMYDAAGRVLPCSVQQYEECTVSVQPMTPWPSGKLKLALAGSLYDCAGNRQNRLFEMKKLKLFKKDKMYHNFRIRSR